MRLYLRILAFGRPYLSNGILGFIFLVLYNLFSVFSIGLVIPFLQILFNTSSSVAPESGHLPDEISMMQQLHFHIDIFIEDYGKWKVLLGVCCFLVASIFLKSLFRYLASWNIAPFEQGVVNNMRNRLFDHLSRLSMSFYTGEKKGKIINVLVTDVQVIQESVIGTVQTIISDPVHMVILITSLFLISWKLTLFTLLILPISGLVINLISKSLKRKARSGQERLGRLISVLDEFVSGIRIVKAFSTEEFEKEKYQRNNEEYTRFMVSIRRRSDLASPLTEVIAIFLVVMVILYGGYLIFGGNAGSLTAESLIGFVILFGAFIAPNKAFSSALSRIQRGIASFHRVEEFLAIEESVKETPGAISMPKFSDAIRYENVAFSYTEEGNPVLDGISFELKKGQTVALVGPSGGGKSTIIDLLSRFYDPTGGKITIDGVDIKNIKSRELRSSIGMVTQEGILFNDTVKGNIAYGEIKPNLESVIKAARVANADEFIRQMPEGYDSIIGERGTRLSGGQRQRLAIARAVYRDTPILVLDEATSALDSESEVMVQQTLDSLKKGRTSIIIAHRLSTIQQADLILVIDHGKILEKGKHEELLKMSGLYRKLYHLQFRENSAED